MKKITYFLVGAFLFIIPFVSVQAQTLTKNDVRIIAPQLGQVLVQLNTMLTLKQNQFAAQDVAVNNLTNTIGSIANTISNLRSQNLNSQDQLALLTSVRSLVLPLGYVNNQLGVIVNERNVFDQVVNNTTSILGSISGIIGSAV